MFRTLLLALGIVLLAEERAGANTTPVASLTQNWSNAGLITINDDWSQVPGIMGRIGDDLTSTTGVDPQTVLMDQLTVDVLANLSSPNAEQAGGVAEFDGIADRVVALQGSNTADAPFLLLTLDTMGQGNVTISYNLRDIDGSADNATTPVALQYRLSTSGSFANLPAGFVADATAGPNLATLVTPVSVLLPSVVNNRPHVQLRIITTNSTGVDEWVGIDDIQVTMGPSCFDDITSGLPLLRGTAAAWGDYDNDGDLDILLSGDPGGPGITRVYRSSGGTNPTFTDIMTGLPGLYAPELEWIDYDSDSDLDIFLAGNSGGGEPVTRLYRNNGGPNPLFTDALVALPGMYGCGASWGDYDNDGDADLLQFGQLNQSLPAVTRLYRNNGEPAPTFTEVAAGLVGAREGAAIFGDYDNDRDLDILMTGMTDPYTVPLVYRNDGNDVFTDVGAGGSDESGVAIDWGDYDADGDLDILRTGQNGTEIWTNVSNGGEHFFTDQHPTYGPGAVQGTAAWGDYDSDGKLDFLTAGFSYWTSVSTTSLFRRIAVNPQFEFVGTGMPGVGDEPSVSGSSTAAFGDADGDNDLDVFLSGGTYSGPYITRVYRNGCGANTRPTAPTGLSVTVVGRRATFQWNAATDAETPQAGLSYNLRVGTAPGLGDIVPPMALSSGIRSIPALGNAMENLSWDIDLPGPGPYWWSVQAIDGAYAGSPFADEQAICLAGFADVTSGVTGTAGGASAWGDYDNDGHLDLVVSGTPNASTFISRIYRYDGLAGLPVFSDINAGLPGTIYGSAAWGDCDNDGDLDLLLTGYDGTGGLARVYRNTGGVFADVGAGLVGTYFGTAAWGDVDTDGDLDIVVTGFDGTNGTARLYRSSGGSSPTFADAGAGFLGMTYSAVSFCDYDVDGDADILITGRPDGGSGFDAVAMLYRNSGGPNFVLAAVPTGLTGVIQGSHAWGDYDADGDPDVVICGENSSQEKVARLHRNPGGANPTFAQVTAEFAGVSAGSAAFGDHDNDGDLDLLVAGHDGTAAFAALYESGGGADPVFIDSGESLPAISIGVAAFGDMDDDHDLDIVMSGLPTSPFGTKVLRNTCRPVNTRPGPPSGLSVSMDGNRATFSWDAAVDNQTPATALSYNIRVGTTSGGTDVVAPMAAVPGGFRRLPAIGNAGQRTSCTIDLPGTGPWYWSVQAIDASYEGSIFATEQAIAQSGVSAEAAPTATALWSAGPNPFSRSTVLGFSLASPAPVWLDIFDAAGRRVRRLAAGELDAGRFERDWDATDDGGAPLPSGLYFARLTTGAAWRSLRLLLVK